MESTVIIQLPEKVEFIIEKLNQAGYEAYAVGGCVRDSILDRNPDDWDITTSAKPLEVKALFDRTIDTGLQHGTVTVLLGRETYEVTTYRVDGEYLDGRHPSEVSFTSNLEEDLRRRDFTINAMAYSRKNGLVDCFEGMKDIQGQQMRCVGIPEERFSEDALRILRAVRFSAQLGFSIEEKTAEAVQKLAPTLEKISAERIRVELNKLLLSLRPEKILDAYTLGITEVVLPELDHFMKQVQGTGAEGRMLKALKNVEADQILRWSMLLQHLGTEEDARRILRRLRFDNETVRCVSTLVGFSSVTIRPDQVEVRRYMCRLGEELFRCALKLRRAILSIPGEDNLFRELEQVEEIFRDILEKGECFHLKMLQISGRDLIAAGYKPGPELGQVLEELLQRVLEQPDLNTKEQLLHLAGAI